MRSLAASTGTSILPFVVTIGVALLGYVATYVNNLMMNRRKDRLDLVNRRINEFYGPLFIATESGEVAFRALWKKLRPQTALPDDRPPLGTELAEMTDAEFVEWRVWCEAVFGPMNDFREKLIHENAYLIEEEDPPECLLQFVTHASAFKVLLQKWKAGDFSERVTTDFPFPETLAGYSRDTYVRLKKEQLELLAKVQRGR